MGLQGKGADSGRARRPLTAVVGSPIQNLSRAGSALLRRKTSSQLHGGEQTEVEHVRAFHEMQIRDLQDRVDSLNTHYLRLVKDLSAAESHVADAERRIQQAVSDGAGTDVVRAAKKEAREAKARVIAIKSNQKQVADRMERFDAVLKAKEQSLEDHLRNVSASEKYKPRTTG